MELFELTRSKRHPTKPGQFVNDRNCTYQELRDALKLYLESINDPDDLWPDESFSLYDSLDYLHTDLKQHPNKPIPDFACIYAWVTPGSSEGFYFHVDVCNSDTEKSPLLLGKTLSFDVNKALEIMNQINRFILIHTF